MRSLRMYSNLASLSGGSADREAKGLKRGLETVGISFAVCLCLYEPRPLEVRLGYHARSSKSVVGVGKSVGKVEHEATYRTDTGLRGKVSRLSDELGSVSTHDFLYPEPGPIEQHEGQWARRPQLMVGSRSATPPAGV